MTAISQISSTNTLFFFGETYHRVFVNGFPTYVFYNAEDNETRLSEGFLMRFSQHISFEPQQPEETTFFYFIDIDERGEFSASVRDEDDKTLFSFDASFFETGFMNHKNDLNSLTAYLHKHSVLPENSRIISAYWRTPPQTRTFSPIQFFT